MEILLGQPVYAWLAFGALLIAVEALTAPGLGLFLGGLGALCTGVIIEAGLVEGSATALQFAWFFGFTTVWSLILWKPLVKFRAGGKHKNDKQVGNGIGDSAIVGSHGLKRGETGQVSWSGTLMNAELDASSPVDFLPPGSHVIIQSVAGTTFTVTPK